ncbi:MAG: Riboflavin biosynthesis protein RibD [Candidatus Accumulibacter sp. BA-94]|nr:MAG: Riboflavin biosynthesis protein RibD [Candidatus Accumulibacter sp. BA-94]
MREDDPQLNVRGVAALPGEVRQPLRIVVDSRLELSPDARVLRGGGTLVVAATADGARSAALAQRGAEILLLPGPGGRVDLDAMLAELARRGVNEVHAEAGFVLSGALLQAGLVDELLLYLAPCLVGDAARGMFALPQLEALADRKQLLVRDLRLIGQDLRLLARFT